MPNWSDWGDVQEKVLLLDRSRKEGLGWDASLWSCSRLSGTCLRVVRLWDVPCFGRASVIIAL